MNASTRPAFGPCRHNHHTGRATPTQRDVKIPSARIFGALPYAVQSILPWNESHRPIQGWNVLAIPVHLDRECTWLRRSDQVSSSAGFNLSKPVRQTTELQSVETRIATYLSLGQAGCISDPICPPEELVLFSARLRNRKRWPGHGFVMDIGGHITEVN